jgi:polar amino acid transport system substrate-binding protein
MRCLVAALSACAVLAAAGCGGGEGAAGSSFKPAKANVLTVATAFLPAPGFWEGNPPDAGFEERLADALAKKLGLERVTVKQVPFASLTSGDLRGADLALSQLTPTKKRENVLAFTTPYLTAPPGILARAAVHATDAAGLRELRWVVSSTSTLTPSVVDRIRPIHPPLVVEDRTKALDVLSSGRADALLLDLPVALGLAHSKPSLFHVLGQLSGSEGLAVALPHGSSNLEIVDSTIRRFQADGTIDDLGTRWLGKSAEDVPLILTEG